jgi:hypothetical protein
MDQTIHHDYLRLRPDAYGAFDLPTHELGKVKLATRNSRLQEDATRKLIGI